MLNDRNVYTKPALPVFGAAGSIVTDPTFGQRILRVTDGATMPSSLNISTGPPSASHQLCWSKSSTKFYLINSSAKCVPYSFNSTTMQASRISGAGDGGLVVTSTAMEPQFSWVNDDLIYVNDQDGTHGTPIVKKYSFVGASYTTVKDLRTIPNVTVADNTYNGGVYSSEGGNEKIVTFFGGVGQDAHYLAAVFEVAAPTVCTVVDTVASLIYINGAAGVPTNITLGFHLHHAQIDRTGRYVQLESTGTDIGLGKAPKYVWDTQTNIITAGTTLFEAHTAMGWGDEVNMSCCTSSAYDNAQMQYRSLAAPNTTRDVIKNLPSPSETYVDGHVTWNNDLLAAPQYIFREFYRVYDGPNDVSPKNLTPWRVWDDEIGSIQTDGIGLTTDVRRFCHHRCIVRDDLNVPGSQPFYYQPRPNVSPDGKWCLFSSNWERTLGIDPQPQTSTSPVWSAAFRYDTFLVDVQTVTTPPPPAPSLGSLGLRRWDLD